MKPPPTRPQHRPLPAQPIGSILPSPTEGRRWALDNALRIYGPALRKGLLEGSRIFDVPPGVAMVLAEALASPPPGVDPDQWWSVRLNRPDPEKNVVTIHFTDPFEFVPSHRALQTVEAPAAEIPTELRPHIP